MSVYVASLNSGSNGNCYYIGTAHDAVLIDAGISCKEILKRMRNLNLSIDKVRAVFISHEHIDHIKGVEVLSKRYEIPVYITPATLTNSRTRPPDYLVRNFTAHEVVQLNEINILPFPKLHDAADPHSFVVTINGINVGVFTDIGAPCSHVTEYFRRCHAAFLEANYDDDMLANGKYPYHLRKRISSDVGHMSNAQALELFLNHRSPDLSHVWLSHLSKDNNSHEVAMEAFRPYAGSVQVSIASRYCETEIFQPGDSVSTTTKEQYKQISLFS